MSFNQITDPNTKIVMGSAFHGHTTIGYGANFGVTNNNYLEKPKQEVKHSEPGQEYEQEQEYRGKDAEKKRPSQTQASAASIDPLNVLQDLEYTSTEPTTPEPSSNSKLSSTPVNPENSSTTNNSKRRATSRKAKSEVDDNNVRVKRSRLDSTTVQEGTEFENKDAKKVVVASAAQKKPDNSRRNRGMRRRI